LRIAVIAECADELETRPALCGRQSVAQDFRRCG